MGSRNAIGSSAWIAAEKENVRQLLEQEKEELTFPARHELEWLNEHMADIFSKSHVNVANVFKTPGKLKGKTPRTTRKQNVLDQRIPLSDVFSSKPYQRASPIKSHNNALRFDVSEDAEVQHQVLKSQADSGYHGSSQVEDDLDTAPPVIQARSPLRTIKSPALEQLIEDDQPTTEGSFHSAKEDQTVKTTEQSQEVIHIRKDQQNSEHQTEAPEEQSGNPPEFDDIGSPSDESTPDRPLVRKGSMTFASLPAREPLKTSIGTRISRTSHVELGKPQHMNRESYISRHQSIVASPRPSHVGKDEEDEDTEMEDSHIEIHGHDGSDTESRTTKQYSKATTQRLHERIDMLGKTAAPRPSKSIPSATVASVTTQKYLEGQSAHQTSNDDDDDWIKPLKGNGADETTNARSSIGGEASEDDHEFDIRAPELIAHEERMESFRSPSPIRPGLKHTKCASTATLASPAKAAMAPPASPAKSISVSNPSFASTSTPQDSPKRFIDGTLSASKSKLHSMMKSAKGLFTSSAGVSAAAKLETLSPTALPTASSGMPGLYPNLDQILENKPLPASPPKETRRTRSSTEREKEEKQRNKDIKLIQKMNDELDKARQKEQLKVTQQRQVQDQLQSPRKETEEREEFSEMLPPNQIGKLGRPVRPIREVSKAKPQPVSIRIGTLSSRMPVNAAPVAPHNQETLQGDPKRPGLTKKASATSMSSNSTATFKSSTASQALKLKAVLAAERRKEQDEREAQRRLELRREVERKRAAMQEEARRKEQKEREEVERKERERVAEQQRKRQAQQDAIERKRQEAARKAEQQKLEIAAQEAAAVRPPSRLGQQTINRPLMNHGLPTNSAKAAKRPLEEENVRPQASKFGAAPQQPDAKRRRTEDEAAEPLQRPTMSGAPIRQSQLGKKPSIFNHLTYTQVPGPSHLNQFPQPPNRTHPQMGHFANAKIPFADASNASSKTPISASMRAIQAIKSSPQIPNGDAIHLPEIPTDSEDEDSDDDGGNAFPLPDWATPGHLTEQLMAQEGMDGDAVFGPVAPLKMEEIFAKGNKDRLKKLRDRTSSANWALSGDGLTLEEVRIDREQRERMRIDGGWRFGT